MNNFRHAANHPHRLGQKRLGQKRLGQKSVGQTVWAGVMMGLLLLAGCGTNSSTPTANSPSPTDPTASETPGATTSPTATPSPTPSPAPSAVPQVTASASGSVPVTIYRLDDQCADFVATQVQLPKASTLDAAIETVLKESNTADFTVASYRVQVSDRLATIELRLPPDSKRQFQSLSSCEQMALFGSLRKTLTSRSEWGIQDVKFTDGQKEIVL